MYIVYLPTAWDPYLVMTGIFENVSATSETFRQFSEDFWTLLKMSEDFPTTFEHFSSYLKDDNINVLWLTQIIIQCLLGLFLWKSYWIFTVYHVVKNNLCGFVSQAWEIVLDAWDQCLKFTGMRLMYDTRELAGITL